MARNESPAEDREDDQAQASHRRPRGVGSGCGGAPLLAVETFLFFSLAFVLFHKYRARGKNSRKREKESADAKPPFAGDQAGDNRYGAARQETDAIFSPRGIPDPCEINSDSHGRRLPYECPHNPKAVSNQSTIDESVAFSADVLVECLRNN